MRKIFVLIAALMFTGAVRADGEGDDEPGQFDYWVLALAWSPQYCYDHRQEPQCTHVYNFVVHGLWPQHETGGAPKNCTDVERVQMPLLSRMKPVMPSHTLIQQQWQKHGSCSGLDAENYFLTIERVHRSLTIPAEYHDLKKDFPTTVEEIESVFAKSNPGLSPEKMALQCTGRFLKEIRVCYDKAFQPRECGEEVRDHCGERVVLRPTR